MSGKFPRTSESVAVSRSVVSLLSRPLASPDLRVVGGTGGSLASSRNLEVLAGPESQHLSLVILSEDSLSSPISTASVLISSSPWNIEKVMTTEDYFRLDPQFYLIENPSDHLVVALVGSILTATSCVAT